MANYLLAYTGGGMAQTEAEREAAMAAWGGWFSQLGAAVLDAGNPVGASTALGAGGETQPTAKLTGYSVIGAADLQAATELAKGCPILTNGGGVEVYEIIPAM